MLRTKITATIPAPLAAALTEHARRLGIGRNALLTLALDLFVIWCPGVGNGKRSQLVASLRKNVQTIIEKADNVA